MKITGQEAPLGKGMVDLKACFQFARANGALQIVDMDAATLEDTCRAGKMLSGWTGDRDNTDSILCTMDVETGEETVLHEFPGIIEAPNWLNDGNTLLYNADGKIYRYEIDKDHVEQVDTGFCVQCNNDHVPSPDNQLLAVSCMPPELTDGTYESHIYVNQKTSLDRVSAICTAGRRTEKSLRTVPSAKSRRRRPCALRSVRFHQTAARKPA